MANIFDRFNYNFSPSSNNAIVEFSQSTLDHLNTVPQLMTDWQKTDMENGDIGGYLKNPVANVITILRNTCNSIYNLVVANTSTNTNIVTGTNSTINTYFVSITTNTSNVGGINGGNFLDHTNRISGVVNVSQTATASGGELTQDLPHFETAFPIGQVVMYLLYQTDGIQNNAPIMGNFTSILIEQELESFNTVLQTTYSQINNSITITGSGTEASPYVRSSNLSQSQVAAIYANTSGLASMLYTRRISDESFYTTSMQIMSEYKAVSGFNKMGLTANNMVQNFIGTDKLKSRINQETTTSSGGTTYVNTTSSTSGGTSSANIVYVSSDGASVYANGAFARANASFDKLTATGTYANGAFIRANNSVDANNGGTITGSLTITNNLTVSNLSVTSLSLGNWNFANTSGKLKIYYGTTALASIDPTGNLVVSSDITAFGTP